AQTWVIPIAGFDPRDPLRGHYVTFRYMWQVRGDALQCLDSNCLICLEQLPEGPVQARIVPRDDGEDCPGRVDPVASHISPDFTSRIFVSETSAPELEMALREGPMHVVALLRRDGILVNRRLVSPSNAASD